MGREVPCKVFPVITLNITKDRINPLDDVKYAIYRYSVHTANIKEPKSTSKVPLCNQEHGPVL
jgi:hypothetical protein